MWNVHVHVHAHSRGRVSPQRGRCMCMCMFHVECACECACACACFMRTAGGGSHLSEGGAAPLAPLVSRHLENLGRSVGAHAAKGRRDAKRARKCRSDPLLVGDARCEELLAAAAAAAPHAHRPRPARQLSISTKHRAPCGGKERTVGGKVEPRVPAVAEELCVVAPVLPSMPASAWRRRLRVLLRVRHRT